MVQFLFVHPSCTLLIYLYSQYGQTADSTVAKLKHVNVECMTLKPPTQLA